MVLVELAITRIHDNMVVTVESRQFTDKTVHRHAFEDSSPTELKTVHQQILYCIYMECPIFDIY